jgi:hypothetical protein
MSTIELGTIYSYKPEGMNELRLALEEVFQEPVRDTQIPSLAGPNDIIQILFDPSLKAATSTAITWLALKIVDKVTDNAIDRGLEKIVHWAKTLRKNGTDVGIGVKIPVRIGIAPSRNALLIIQTDDPAEILKYFKSIDYCKIEIARIFAEHEDSSSDVLWGNNPDNSVEIVVLENSDVQILGHTIQGPNH